MSKLGLTGAGSTGADATGGAEAEAVSGAAPGAGCGGTEPQNEKPNATSAPSVTAPVAAMMIPPDRGEEPDAIVKECPSPYEIATFRQRNPASQRDDRRAGPRWCPRRTARQTGLTGQGATDERNTAGQCAADGAASVHAGMGCADSAFPLGHRSAGRHQLCQHSAELDGGPFPLRLHDSDAAAVPARLGVRGQRDVPVRPFPQKPVRGDPQPAEIRPPRARRPDRAQCRGRLDGAGDAGAAVGAGRQPGCSRTTTCWWTGRFAT